MSLGATLDQIAHLDLAYAPPYAPPIDALLTAVHVLQNKLDEKGFQNVSFIEGGLVGWPYELRAGA